MMQRVIMDTDHHAKQIISSNLTATESHQNESELNGTTTRLTCRNGYLMFNLLGLAIPSVYILSCSAAI